MNVFALRNEGGYEEYAYDVTDKMKDVFMGVKKAYVCFYADNIKDAKQKAKDYWDEKDIKKKNFEMDSDTLVLCLENGNVIKIWNSEWGGINSVKDSSLHMDNAYSKLIKGAE